MDWRGGTADLQTIKRQIAAVGRTGRKLGKQTFNNTSITVTGDWEVRENQIWPDMTRRQIQPVTHSNQSQIVSLSGSQGARPGSYKRLYPIIHSNNQLGCPTVTRRAKSWSIGIPQPSSLPRFPPYSFMPQPGSHDQQAVSHPGQLGCTLQGRCCGRDALPWSPQQQAQDTLCRSIPSSTIRKLRVSRPSRVTRRTTGQNTLLGGKSLFSSHISFLSEYPLRRCPISVCLTGVCRGPRPPTRLTYSTTLYIVLLGRSISQSFKARSATSPPVNSIITIPALLNDATYTRGI